MMVSSLFSRHSSSSWSPLFLRVFLSRPPSSSSSSSSPSSVLLLSLMTKRSASSSSFMVPLNLGFFPTPKMNSLKNTREKETHFPSPPFFGECFLSALRGALTINRRRRRRAAGLLSSFSVFEIDSEESSFRRRGVLLLFFLSFPNY